MKLGVLYSTHKIMIKYYLMELPEVRTTSSLRKLVQTSSPALVSAIF